MRSSVRSPHGISEQNATAAGVRGDDVAITEPQQVDDAVSCEFGNLVGL